jgi:hypothetical protein
MTSLPTLLPNEVLPMQLQPTLARELSRARFDDMRRAAEASRRTARPTRRRAS